MKEILIAFVLLFLASSEAIAQHKSIEDLERARLSAKSREEGLLKARGVLKARIDRMRTRLESQEKLLEEVNQRLDHTRQNIGEIEKVIQSKVAI